MKGSAALIPAIQSESKSTLKESCGSSSRGRSGGGGAEGEGRDEGGGDRIMRPNVRL